MGEENQQPANPTQTLEILTVDSTDQKGKTKKQNENPNANFRIGDAPTMNNQP